MQSKLSVKGKRELRRKLYERDKRYVIKCHYCGIKEDDFLKIWGPFRYGRRGKRLEIDHKDSELGDDLENCVLACYACNNAKSDVFDYEEFKRVGKVIEEIWQQRKKSGVAKRPLIGK